MNNTDWIMDIPDRKGAEGSADDAARPLSGGRKTFFQVLPELRFHGVFPRCCNAQTLQPAILHVRTGTDPTAYRTGLDCSGILPMAHTYPWRYACAADGFKAVWLDGSETRETCYDGFKAGPTVLERSGRL